MPSGRLHVCAVPIGNLQDASPRLRQVLGSVDAIACEDTRTTGKLLQLLDIVPPPRLLAHHEHNERDSAPGVVALLEAGSDVALVTDAGTPAVSDPGVTLVTAAHEAGVEVVAVPGASAVATALSVAGIGGAGWRFAGFLPRGVGPLTDLVRTHAHEVLVAFEAPGRVAASLAAIAAEQPERLVALCRELTKRHEQVRRASASILAGQLAAEDAPKGEIVLVLAPLALPEQAGADPRAVALVQAMRAEGVGLKQASRIAAEHLGGSARDLYKAALADSRR